MPYRKVQDLIDELEGFDPESPIRIAMLPEGHSYKIEEIREGYHRTIEGVVVYLHMGTQEAYDHLGEPPEGG